MEPIDIYKLEIHESATVGFFRITRVPGGWVYERKIYDRPGFVDEEVIAMSCVFVPFHNEFQTKD